MRLFISRVVNPELSIPGNLTGINTRSTKKSYSLFRISAGLLRAAFNVWDPIIMQAINNTPNKPANSSMIPIGLWKGKFVSTMESKKK